MNSFNGIEYISANRLILFINIVLVTRQNVLGIFAPLILSEGAKEKV